MVKQKGETVVTEPSSQLASCSNRSPYPIVLAEVEHLEPLSQLLNAHRMVLGKPDEQPAVSHFLFERLINHEVLIFLALEDEQSMQGKGFLSLYPTFSAQSLMPVWILGELYVTPEARQQGVAKSLLQSALSLIQQRGDEGIIFNLSAECQPILELEDLLSQLQRLDEHYLSAQIQHF